MMKSKISESTSVMESVLQDIVSVIEDKILNEGLDIYYKNIEKFVEKRDNKISRRLRLYILKQLSIRRDDIPVKILDYLISNSLPDNISNIPKSLARSISVNFLKSKISQILSMLKISKLEIMRVLRSSKYTIIFNSMRTKILNNMSTRSKYTDLKFISLEN